VLGYSVVDTRHVPESALTDHGVSAGFRRPQIVQLAALSVLMYVAAVVVVRLFDYMINRDQLAQLRQQGGRVYEIDCATCASTSTTLTAWATDERALLLWALIALATTVGIAITRRTADPRRRVAR
jgi:hypothetical protein